jgi:hypothetical protein
MSVSHPPSLETEGAWSYPRWRQQFRRDLAAAGMEFLQLAGRTEWWGGTLEVCWDEPITGEYHVAQHDIRIALPPAFPFARPDVVPCDTNPPIRNGRHQAPGNDTGALCLWPTEDAGWLPSMTADDLLARIRTWFIHYHRDDWPSEDRPPDLHLYFPTPTTHPLMLIGDDWQPLVNTKVGRFGIWQKDEQRAFAGAPMAGVSNPPLTHTDRIVSTLSMAERQRDRIGLWFRLLCEPRPYTTLGEMLTEIDAAAHEATGWALAQMRTLFGIKIRDRHTQVILALGYPDATGAEQWLFLRANLGSIANITYWAQPGRLRTTAVESYETASVGRDALMRRTGHIANLVGNRRILVFGQGAIGGSITILLAKAGLQHLRIVDRDVLRPGNAVRHVGGLLFTGYGKASVVHVEAHNHAPDCSILAEKTSWDPDALTTWIREADAVVDATANPSFSLFLNELCVHETRTAIYVTAHRKAAIGRVRIVRPGQDACLVCYEGGYRGMADYLRIPPGDEGWFVEGGCGVPSVEASAVDIEAIANWAARAVLWSLSGRLTANNHCLIVNDVLPDVSGSLGQIGVHWDTWAPLPCCEACGQPQGQHDHCTND